MIVPAGTLHAAFYLEQVEYSCKFTNSTSSGPDPNQYYYTSCIEQIFGDLSALVETGNLKMEGRFHPAVEDGFRYSGRTLDIKCYESYSKEHNTWEIAFSTRVIEHQLGHPRVRANVSTD
jgi:hypothetical protein